MTYIKSAWSECTDWCLSLLIMLIVIGLPVAVIGLCFGVWQILAAIGHLWLIVLLLI
jgi:hypothetical protein